MWPNRFPLPSTLVLAAIAVWLGAKIIWFEPELIATPASASVPESVSMEPSANAVADIDLEQFKSTLQRPLFVHTRQPIVLLDPNATTVQTTRQPAPAAAPLSADHIRLSGMIGTDDSSMVYLDINGIGEWVPVKASFDGWQVVEILENKVVLRKEGHTEVKFLYAP